MPFGKQESNVTTILRKLKLCQWWGEKPHECSDWSPGSSHHVHASQVQHRDKSCLRNVAWSLIIPGVLTPESRTEGQEWKSAVQPVAKTSSQSKSKVATCKATSQGNTEKGSKALGSLVFCCAASAWYISEFYPNYRPVHPVKDELKTFYTAIEVSAKYSTISSISVSIWLLFFFIIRLLCSSLAFDDTTRKMSFGHRPLSSTFVLPLCRFFHF